MLCTLSRLQISNALDHRGALPWPARGHAARCDDCAAFARRMDGLHGRLSGGVAAAPAPARPSRTRALPVTIALVAAAAAALLVYVAVARSPERAPSRRPSPVAVAPTPPAEVTPAPAADTPARALVDQAGGLLSAPPLRDELTALVNDGRRGAIAVLDQAGLR
jgi:hypothetical protein